MSVRQGAVQGQGDAEVPSPSRPDGEAEAAAARPGADGEGAAECRTAEAQAGPGPDTIRTVERAIFLHHPYEGRERLRRALPGEIDARSLDRALDILERSGKIAIEGESIRPAPGASGPRGGQAGVPAAGKTILAGTCFEWIEEGKLPTETIGEHIVRVANAHEPGSYTAEDAKEFDEDMRRAAKGDYYTHEEFWKEFGP